MLKHIGSIGAVILGLFLLWEFMFEFMCLYVGAKFVLRSIDQKSPPNQHETHEMSECVGMIMIATLMNIVVGWSIPFISFSVHVAMLGWMIIMITGKKYRQTIYGRITSMVENYSELHNALQFFVHMIECAANGDLMSCISIQPQSIKPNTISTEHVDQVEQVEQVNQVEREAGDDSDDMLDE